MKTTPFALPKWIFLSLVMLLITPHISFAMSSNTKANIDDKQVEEKLQQYTWYDGNQKRSVWVNPSLMAEFNMPTEGTTAVKSSSTSNVKTQMPFVRFIKIKTDASTLQTERKIQGKSQLSPVLHNVASTTGTKRALPGNVIVQMQRDWSQEKIENWFKKHNLTAIKPLTFAPNAFLIQSKAGLESLNLANKLYETGDVVLASPNWWQERVKR